LSTIEPKSFVIAEATGIKMAKKKGGDKKKDKGGDKGPE